MNRESIRVSAEARAEAAHRSFAERIESLIRSLAGVQATRVDAASAQLRAVYVVPVPGASTRGITRNVQSALMAAHGLAIDSRMIFIVPELPDVVAQAPEAPVPAPEPTPAAPQAQRRVAAVGFIGASALQAFRATPRIELLELHRFNQDQLQCRVVIELGGRRRSGSAEAGEEREGAVTLAARATLDALRHIEEGAWIFEGAADVIIGGQRHVCVSVKKNEDGASLSGAAAVHESVEHAVASAVLNAAGLAGTLNDPNRRLVQHQ